MHLNLIITEQQKIDLLLPSFCFWSLITLNWPQTVISSTAGEEGDGLAEGEDGSVTPPITAGTLLLIKKNPTKFNEQGEILLWFKSVLR